MKQDACDHITALESVRRAKAYECEECVKIGARWVHLRTCQTCGGTRCCDSSPNKHATAHFRSAGHPLMRSVQPGEDWCWCFEDELAMRIAQIEGSPSIPPSPLCP